MKGVFEKKPGSDKDDGSAILYDKDLFELVGYCKMRFNEMERLYF